MPNTLFKQALGESFSKLPPLLQQMHDGTTQRWAGMANVSWGQAWWTRTLLRLMGMPRPGEHIPCEVDFIPTAEGEKLQRNFSGQRFHSHLRASKGDMIESIGPIRLHLASEVKDQELLQHCASTRLLGIPLPKIFGIRIAAREWCSAQGMHFDVAVALSCGHILLRYTGQLQPQS